MIPRRDDIEDFLRNFGAFKIGFADTKLESIMMKSGYNPRNAIKNYNSVIVSAFHAGLGYYATLNYCQRGNVESRVLSIYHD